MSLYLLSSDVHWALSLLTWVSFTILLVLFAVYFTAYVAPSAAGSGIPEMKTILRGVKLKEYLTARTLLAKVISIEVTIL